MLNAATMSSAASASANAQLGETSRQPNDANSPNAPTFSQALSASKSAQSESQPAPKNVPAPRSPRASSTSDDSGSPTAPSRDPKHSESKSNAVVSTLTFVLIPTIPLPVVVPPISVETNGTTSLDDQAASRTGSARGSTTGIQSNSDVPVDTASNDPDSSFTTKIDLDELIDEAVDSDGDDASQEAKVQDAASAQPQDIQPQPNQNTAPQQQPAIAAPNDGHSSQPSVTPHSATTQSADSTQLQLPNTATLISAIGDTNSSVPLQSTTEIHQLTPQSTSSSSLGINNTSQTNVAQAAQPPLPPNNSNSGNSNSNNSAPQYGAHSPAQPSNQSSDARGTNDPKAGAGGDSSQATQQTNTGTAPTNASSATSFTNATALAASSAHVTAQAAAQAGASVASASVKSSDPGGPGAQPPSLATLVSNVPHSRTDVSQATQLYQRVGGAEMHIAVNTDLLGSIDLRAVVHQGSLSATISVQHADIQTLLVNELPALQHSLSEKNLQVGQISVLAGSIGNGANPNSQPRQDQQNRQNAAPSRVFRDESPSPLISLHSVATAVAAAMGKSARLSVLA